MTIVHECKINDLIKDFSLVPEWLLQIAMEGFLCEFRNVIFCDIVCVQYFEWNELLFKEDFVDSAQDVGVCMCGQNCKDVQQSTFNLILYSVHLIIGLFSHASMHHFLFQ